MRRFLLNCLLIVALLLWRKAKPRTLLIWFFLLLLIPVLINGALWGLIELSRATGGGAVIDQMFDQQLADYAVRGEQADLIYATGTFAEVTAQRMRDMNFMFSIWPFMGFNVVAMMLLGMYVGKRHIFSDIPSHLPLIRRVWMWGLIIGLLGNFVYVYLGEMGNRAIPTAFTVFAVVGQTFGAPALALFYMTSLILLAERAKWRQRLLPLALVGRMALTNYLLQSLICTTLFFGYGFGLYGIGIAVGVAVAVVIYGFEVLLSSWWLARYRFGPMEGLWRTLSYGKRQSMRMTV
ncbi:MAG: DUF418 domain-containing protein [Caldilineaceae bacterium]|nr:DUF418 domain-containing protein [Caldilineaceae bacterium]HRJ43196.1 DUF418 domain-containing protein [Caldilineaceae bacterium]